MCIYKTVIKGNFQYSKYSHYGNVVSDLHVHVYLDYLWYM